VKLSTTANDAKTVKVIRSDKTSPVVTFDLLPRTLFPQVQQRWKPPVYHYGYTFTLEFLESYAKEHGCYETFTNFCNLTVTIRNVLKFLEEKAVITSCRLTFDPIKYKHEPDGKRVVGLFTILSNYARQYHGPYDWATRQDIVIDVRKLQRFLGKAELPKWYLDYHHDRWAERSMVIY